MTNQKVTKKIALEYCIKYIEMDDSWTSTYDPDEIIAKLKSMIDQLDKKSTTERKPSAKQVENDAIRSKILDFLRDDSDKGFRISEICAGVPELADATSQRVSGLLRTLYLNGMVDKYVDKRVTYFKAMDI